MGPAIGVVDVAAEGLRGTAGFEPVESDEAEVRFLSNGIIVDVERLELGPLRLLALVEGEHLKTNVAESAIVRDDAWENAMTAVLAAREGALTVLSRQLVQDADRLRAGLPLLRRALRVGSRQILWRLRVSG